MILDIYLITKPDRVFDVVLSIYLTASFFLQ